MSTPQRTTSARRYRTVFVDPDLLRHAADRRTHDTPRDHAVRLIGVERHVAGVRRNVRDAARAVLVWLASVMEQQDGDLNALLNDCLRPGPDAAGLNYAALTEKVNACCGCNLSAKRVRTAVENLRHVSADTARRNHTPSSSLVERLAQTRRRLAANYDQLIAAETPHRAEVRRAIGTELLAALRLAAHRLIEKPYAEELSAAFDPPALEGRLLAFVRDAVKHQPLELEGDLQRILRSLGRADQTPESDMAIVVASAKAVCGLLGPDSLPGVLAQLNVLVVGRDMLGTPLYVSELARLAELAEALHSDRAAQQYQNWARRLDESARVPTAIRVASFARNNLATHILQRLITQAIKDVATYLPLAESAIEAMRRSDGSFRLLPVTQAIHATALAELGIDERVVHEMFSTMEVDAATQLLADLADFDSSRAVVQAVRRRAIEAQPALRFRLIAV
ncbi:MAG: hypothetical protein IT445_07925 [Phycisphaeraceae bacterium]|nr:hypothetical protein [Phycisphaeraceae bacterium]